MSHACCAKLNHCALPPSPPPVDGGKPHTFNLSLTVYSLLKKKTTRGTHKASTLGEEKTTKVKELHFGIDDNNYIDFLTSLLEKHGQEQYKVSWECHFPFKCVPP